MKKALSVFSRDFKIVIKDPMAIWIGLAPILLAVIIVLVSPGINDSFLHLAIQSDVDNDFTDKMSEYAQVEIFDSLDEVESRVLRRDEVIGIVNSGSSLELVAQGNEAQRSIEIAKVLRSLYEMDALSMDSSDLRFTFMSFRETTPPLKRSLSVALLLMVSVVSSMVISLGLVDEKTDNTIKAADVTPMNQTSYVLSKSIIGVLLLIFSSVVSLLVLGMYSINWPQILLMILANGLISIIVAFLIGLSSTDFIEAAGSIKGLMVPMIASILVYEMAGEQWHWTVMWSPFFWAYRGMTEIINNTATWGSILMHVGIILVICAVVYKAVSKNIRKALV